MNVKLQAGDSAPDFDLEMAGGGRITLDDLRGAPAVVWFYPAASTPLCTRQACDLRDNFAELTANGARIVGISPDPIEKVENFRSNEELPYTMAADPSRETLKSYGAWGEKNMYGKLIEGVIRSTFVLDPDGKIVSAKYRVGTPKHVEFVMNALDLIR